jgi:cytochrome o ubiquinol oxidase subunit IV
MANHTDIHPDYQDLAPGEERAEDSGIARGIRGYLVGLLLAAGLTVVSFYVAGTHLIWGPGVPVALIVLAIAQMGVHLVFFLHITTSPDSENNILALAFGVLFVAVVIIGSVWIMDHLNSNVMTKPQVTMPQVLHMQ